MAKNEARGTKRVCSGCDAKFYDLNKDEIVCPLCGTIYETEALISKKEAEAEVPDDEEDTADEGVDLVSLDELEKEEDDETLIEDEEAIADIDDDTDVDVSDDDDTFLEDDDDDGTDVTKLVGGGKGGGSDD